MSEVWVRRQPATSLAVLAASIAFAIYMLTLTNGVGWGDSAELTVTSHVLGVPHPPGYPLYTLLGHLFSMTVPFGSVAYKANLMSAVVGAVDIGILYLALLRITRRGVPAFFAALAIAFSSSFWEASVVAEVYTFHLLFVALIVLFMLLWRDVGQTRYLYLTAAVFGLSLAHHGMTYLLLPAIVFGMFCLRRHRFTRGQALGILAASTIWMPLYLYLPLRQLAAPPLDMASLIGVDLAGPGLLWYISGAFYRQALTNWTFQSLYYHFSLALSSLTADLLVAGALLSYLGAVKQLKEAPRTFVFFLLLFASNLIFISFYRVVDTPAFAGVLSFLAAPWLAVGAACAFTRATSFGKGRIQRLFSLGILAILDLAILLYNWQGMAAYRDARSGQTFGQYTLKSLPPDSVLLFSWPDWPLWYSQKVDGIRPDVEIVEKELVFPTGRSFAGVVSRSSAVAVNRELAERYVGRALFSLQYDPDMAAEWAFEDVGAAYRLVYKGHPEITPAEGPASDGGPAFGGLLRLRHTSVAPRSLSAGGLIRVSLSWEVMRTPSAHYDLGFRFQTRSSDKDVRAFAYRMPLGYGVTPASAWTEGSLVSEYYDLIVPTGAATGTYSLTLVLGTEEGLLPRSDATGVDIELAQVRVDGR